MENKKRKRVLSQAEVIGLSDFIKAAIVVSEDGSVAHYRDGWNDLRVIDDCGIAGVNSWHVVNLRTILFPNFQTTSRFAQRGPLTERVVALEAELLRVNDRLAELAALVKRSPKFPGM